MQRNKRGLSDVVTTVLLLLLAIVAIIILWALMKPYLYEGGSKINPEHLTSPVQLVPHMIVVNNVTNKTTVIVKRKANSYSIIGYYLIFTDSEDDIAKVREGINMSELEEIQAEYDYVELGLKDLVSIEVCPIFGASDGTEVIGRVCEKYDVRDRTTGTNNPPVVNPTPDPEPDPTPIPGDTTPPAQISNLQLTSRTTNSLTWTWTNPSSDFYQSIISIDGINVINTSSNTHTANNFAPDTQHTISIKTKDQTGNVNNNAVTNTGRTLAESTPETTPPVTGVTSGLFAYYSFNNQNANDDSGNNNHGALVNEPSYIADGLSGGAYDLTYQDLNSPRYLDVVYSGDLTSAISDRSYTLSFWVNLDSQSDFNYLLTAYYHETSNFMTMESLKGNPDVPKLINYYKGSGIPNQRISYSYDSNEIKYDDNWDHLIFSYDKESNSTKLYLNGKDIPIYDDSTNQINKDLGHLNGGNGELDLYIGLRTPSSGVFEGLLDEVKLYNRALTYSEVIQECNLHKAAAGVTCG